MLHGAGLLVLCASTVGAQDRDVVFQHGLNSSGTTWTTEANALEQVLQISPWAPSSDWHKAFTYQGAQLASSVATADLDAILIGHSNGGVIGRAANLPAPYPARAWGGLVTVGTPHTGAHLATSVLNGDVGAWLNDLLWDAADAGNYYEPLMGDSYIAEVSGAIGWISGLGARVNTFASAVGNLAN
ncbi:MAG TPA: alpha/beta hydrolase [Gemmatimonadaceae bacterium]|nr:alpha/beta hydrolase [Gemmatimonadaceae bacterium]